MHELQNATVLPEFFFVSAVNFLIVLSRDGKDCRFFIRMQHTAFTLWLYFAVHHCGRTQWDTISCFNYKPTIASHLLFAGHFTALCCSILRFYMYL